MPAAPGRLLAAAAAATFVAAVDAQTQHALFTGRFPFVSRDAPNERPGGAITRLEEFDFSYAVPSPAGSVARTLLPATAMQCYLGDGDGDGVFTKFFQWKTYFQEIGVGGVFVRAADRAAVAWDEVYFTVRRGPSAGALQLEVLVGGSPVTLHAGDWVRLLPNGDAAFFATAAQFAIAAGPQPGSSQVGAGALLQAANGDLYYAPIDGGHWVNGNQTGAVFAQDGAIVKIDAANIVYDAAGQVVAFAPSSARLLVNEAVGGPGGAQTVRQMVLNSGAMNHLGLPIAAGSSYGKTTGLALDPGGGTWTPVWPDAVGAYPPEPNLLWCSEALAYGGTLFTTANGGAIAQINGVLCGSGTPGVPADGAWLGVELDVLAGQPSLLGFTLCDGLAYEPLIADQNDFGSLAAAAAEPDWAVDLHGAPNLAVFGLVAAGPTAPTRVVPSIGAAMVPLGFAASTWPDLYLTSVPLTLGASVTDAFGYATLSIPNPHDGTFAGFTLMVQALGLAPGGFQLSSPLLVQLR